MIFLVVGFFVPELFAVVGLLFFIFGTLDWLMAAKSPKSSKMRFNVPVIPQSVGVSSTIPTSSGASPSGRNACSISDRYVLRC